MTRRILFAKYASIPIIVESITPNSGSTAGGESLTIIGSGFTGVVAVTIGGTDIPIFTIVSDTQIDLTAPAHIAAVDQSVVVYNIEGQSTPNGFYTWIEAVVLIPVIVTSITPNFFTLN